MTIHIVVPTPMLSSKGKGVGSVSSAGAIAQQKRMENNLICFSPASGRCISIPTPMALSQETDPSLLESHGEDEDRRVLSVVLREQSLASFCCAQLGLLNQQKPSSSPLLHASKDSSNQDRVKSPSWMSLSPAGVHFRKSWNRLMGRLGWGWSPADLHQEDLSCQMWHLDASAQQDLDLTALWQGTQCLEARIVTAVQWDFMAVFHKLCTCLIVQIGTESSHK